MRVAAIYDVHGNLPALEAVLAEIRGEGVDLIVVGGDVIPGPMPRASVAALQNLDVPVRFIQGNGEREVLAQLAGEFSGAVPERFLSAMRWVGERLLPEQVEWLASWPQTLSLEVGEMGRVLFCHATPGSDSEVFTRMTPEERLLPLFDPAEARWVICGHTHMQFDRMVGTVRVVNAGSVGMPFGTPGAYWLLLGPSVALRCTHYDREAAADRIEATDYPQAQEFAAGNVLRTPSEQEMVELFERSAVR